MAFEGDPCAANTAESYACTGDQRRALTCRDTKWGFWRACKGPEACRVTAGTLRCDTSLADVADPCGVAGAYACSRDRRLLLVCRAGKLDADSACRGPGGCAPNPTTGQLTCDASVGRENDPCDAEESLTCSEDSKVQFVCRGHRYLVKQACKKGCMFRKGQEPLCLK